MSYFGLTDVWHLLSKFQRIKIGHWFPQKLKFSKKKSEFKENLKENLKLWGDRCSARVTSAPKDNFGAM